MFDELHKKVYGDCFILEDGKFKKVPFSEYIKWTMTGDNDRVDETTIEDQNTRISTIFLGMKAPSLGDVPLYFETLIDGGSCDGKIFRYATYGDAKKGHWEIVDCLRNNQDPTVSCGEKSPLTIFDEFIRMHLDD
jgi:hypothetical protein